MNSLSWMLYLADVCDGINGPLGFISTMSGVVTLIALIAFVISATYVDTDEEAKHFNGSTKLALKITVPTFFITFLLVVFTPSKDTIYAIAASEMGEEVLKSETATKAQRALDAWLDKQIGEQPEKAQ